MTKSLIVSVAAAVVLILAGKPAQAQTCAVWSNAENRCLQETTPPAQVAACAVWSLAERRCLDQDNTAEAKIHRAAEAARQAALERIQQQRQAAVTPIVPQLAIPAPPPAAVATTCAARWPKDFSMQAFCRQSQTEALGTLATRHQTIKPGTVGATIQTTCAERWPTDFSMRNFCEEQQIKSLATLR